MKVRLYHVAIGVSLLGIASCDDTSTIGSSLLEDQVEIIVDSTFTLSGKTIPTGAIRPRTVDQLIGSIDIPGYGSIKSNVVSQFLPTTSLDTANYSSENVDSIFLNFAFPPGSFIGDSVAPLGLTVYPLTKQLPSQLASDFNADGYYNPSSPLASTIYNASTLDNDSLSALNYRTISLKLPVEFGRNLFKKFQDNPESYANGQIFAKDVFPGMFVKSTFGSGRLTLVTRTTMTMYLHNIKLNSENKLDTLDAVHEYYMVSPEVLNNNNLKVELATSVENMVEEGKTLMVAPASYQVKLRFPAPEIISAFKRADTQMSVLNSLTLEIPADTIPTGSSVVAPPYALLVLEKDYEEFFAKNKLPDNKSSFYSAYNSSKKCYSFPSLRTYITDLLEKDEIKEEDYTFILAPVQVTMETISGSYYQTETQVETDVVPYISTPAMADVRLEDAKIKLTYSLQTQKK